jgi:hypothetical protein
VRVASAAWNASCIEEGKSARREGAREPRLSGKELHMYGPSLAMGDERGLQGVDASVLGVFGDPDDVDRAVRRLTAKSVPVDSIRVFVVDERGRRRREIAVEDEAGALRGALTGAGLGALVGVLTVILVPVLTGGASVGGFGVSSLFGALRAVALCAAAGVPLGAIIGMGRWQGRKKIAETGLGPHRIYVAVDSDQMASVARAVLEDEGAERVEGRAGYEEAR